MDSRVTECFKCNSIIKECTTNLHSDGILAHSDTSVTGVLAVDKLLVITIIIIIVIVIITVIRAKYLHCAFCSVLQTLDLASLITLWLAMQLTTMNTSETLVYVMSLRAVFMSPPPTITGEGIMFPSSPSVRCPSLHPLTPISH